MPSPSPRLGPMGSGEYGYRPTTCPRCGESVYFVRPQRGGAVWFDDMGWPWPKHDCFDYVCAGTITAAINFVTNLPGVRANEPMPHRYIVGPTSDGEIVRDADYRSVDLSDRGLRDSIFIGCDFTGANLAGADLTGSTLLRCNFSAANLSDAVLRRCDLRGSDFSDACMLGADLYEADLADSTLDRPELQE